MKVRVLITGLFREFDSKGKKHTFSEIWVSLPGLPHPVQLDHYGVIDLAPGDYDVPMLFEVRDRRAMPRYNFHQAVPVKAAL